MVDLIYEHESKGAKVSAPTSRSTSLHQLCTPTNTLHSSSCPTRAPLAAAAPAPRSCRRPPFLLLALGLARSPPPALLQAGWPVPAGDEGVDYVWLVQVGGTRYSAAPRHKSTPTTGAYLTLTAAHPRAHLNLSMLRISALVKGLCPSSASTSSSPMTCAAGTGISRGRVGAGCPSHAPRRSFSRGVLGWLGRPPAPPQGAQVHFVCAHPAHSSHQPWHPPPPQPQGLTPGAPPSPEAAPPWPG